MRSRLLCRGAVVFIGIMFMAGCSEEVESDSDTGSTDAGFTDAGDGDVIFSDDTGVESDVDDIKEDVDPWDRLPPEPWSSQEPGPFDVAYRYETFVYTPSGESEEPREIDVSIWYPTFEDDGSMARYFGILNQEGIWQDAPPALREPAPVMLFSHGNAALSVQSYFWTEFLASHGWIVIAPDHTGNTFADTQGAIDLKSAVYRPQDLSAALDFVVDLPDDDPLTGMASDIVGVSGHSFGGTTTLSIADASFPVDQLLSDCDQGVVTGRYCDIISEENADLFRSGFLDERIGVAIPQSPGGGDFFADHLDSIEMPVLLWTAEQDQMTSNVDDGDPIWEALNGSHDVRIDVAAAAHFTFSNMCDYFGSIPDIAEEGCGDEFIDTAVIHPIHNAYSLEFLRLHLGLKGSDEAASWFSQNHDPLHENLIFSFH